MKLNIVPGWSRPVLQWKSHVRWFDTNLVWWLWLGSSVPLTLMTALGEHQSVPWWQQMTEGVSRASDHRRESTRLAILNSTMATMQCDDQCGICQALVSPAPLMTKWLGAVAVWMGAILVIAGDQQKRGRGQCQSPSLLKTNAWPWTLNWWQDQSIYAAICPQENGAHNTLYLGPWFWSGHTADWKRIRFVRARLCRAFEGSKVGLQVAGGLPTLCSHSQGTCSQRHLLT